MLITTNDAFENWLDERNQFRLSQLSNITPMPNSAGDERLREASFDVSQIISGSLWAGEKQTIERLRLTAHGVTQLTYSDLPRLLEHGFYDIEVSENTERLHFNIDENLMVECEQLTVETLDIETVAVQPALSNQDASVTFASRTFITPGDWISMFEDVGLSVVFRRLGDVATPANEVASDYTGWFLQMTDLLSQTDYGLMFDHLEHKHEIFSVNVRMWYQDSEYAQPLWFAFQQIIAGQSGATVQSGNCRLTGSDWLLARQLGNAWLREHFGA